MFGPAVRHDGEGEKDRDLQLVIRHGFITHGFAVRKDMSAELLSFRILGPPVSLPAGKNRGRNVRTKNAGELLPWVIYTADLNPRGVGCPRNLFRENRGLGISSFW